MLPLHTFLPGRLSLRPGIRADYFALDRFHYRPGPPATWAAVWTITFTLQNEPTALPRPIAAAVLSYPCLNVPARTAALSLDKTNPSDRAAFVNAHVRTISRVIVHPQFRSLGLAVLLARHAIAACPTRYVEALAQMGRAHPLFTLAGMRLQNEPTAAPDKPLYYLCDRERPTTEHTKSTETRSP